jgi:predicted membrane channel-forming protein YqfA (hemolysin III family)
MIFGATLPICLAVLRHLHLPTAVRYLIPAVPLFAGVQYLRVLVRDMRQQMDELQLRIYLEAAAVVVCGLFIVMVMHPLLEAAQLVGPLDYLEVLVVIVVLGIVGYISGVRRYR